MQTQEADGLSLIFITFKRGRQENGRGQAKGETSSEIRRYSVAGRQNGQAGGYRVQKTAKGQNREDS
jgi:hypothetical protein